MIFVEKNKKDNREMSDEGVKVSSVLLCLMVAIIVFGVIDLVPEKTRGVVEKKDKNLLYVKNLQDTSKHVVFSADRTLNPYGIKAFPYVAVGDTLEYGTHGTSVSDFNMVKRINSKKMAEFLKERKKTQHSASGQKIR